MNTAQRRTEILKLLQQEEKPVAARAMASQFGVSRQVIVQDMAVIRACYTGESCQRPEDMCCSMIKILHAPGNLKYAMGRSMQRRN